MGTAQTPQTAAAEPRAGTPVVPTPTPHEINTFLTQVASGTVPPVPWFHKWDNSPVDPQSFSQTIGAPTWP
jgi:hypothetical protein